MTICNGLGKPIKPRIYSKPLNKEPSLIKFDFALGAAIAVLVTTIVVLL